MVPKKDEVEIHMYELHNAANPATKQEEKNREKNLENKMDYLIVYSSFKGFTINTLVTFLSVTFTNTAHGQDGTIRQSLSGFVKRSLEVPG